MKNKFLGLVAVLAMTLTVGCATEEKLTGTQIVPGAQGKVTAVKAAGDNTNLTVEVAHLAQPDRVSAGASNYVVWIQPQGSSQLQNVGVLNVDKDLEGTYKTTVPYRDFRVMVTPESAGNAIYPTGPAVFDQTISR